ncbi:MAG: patatin-like phospholipase family protein [Casimicrobium sp.]
MKALRIYAGPRALARIRERGLAPSDVRVIPAAAGGPKGLMLLALDRFLFGEWLPQSKSSEPVDLLGASIGAWRMAAACLNDPVSAIDKLEHDYIHQEYDVPPGKKGPTPDHVSEKFGAGIAMTFGDREHEVLSHSRYRLHIVTSRGRHMMRRETKLRAGIGYASAYFTNVVSRKAMGAWIERAVFSSRAAPLPFATHDYRTRRYGLTAQNFASVVQASCSIPFVLRAVHDILGAPRGAYWDGGITDYHLHLDYRTRCNGASNDVGATEGGGVVLYPHFQKTVVPGWLDKSLKWRHKSTHFLDDVVVLAPNPDWIATLPNKKIPDRQDFMHYGRDTDARVRVWKQAVAESVRLRDEFAEMLYSRTIGSHIEAL